jgi:hypothetical protein
MKLGEMTPARIKTAVASRMLRALNSSHLMSMRNDIFDYPLFPVERWNQSVGPNLPIMRLLERQHERYRESLQLFLSFEERFLEIERVETQPSTRPSWENSWLPPIDAISIYSYVAHRRPGTFLEIGSGNSTKFARQAINDFHLETRVISIDPSPRAEIDGLCSEVIRLPFEKVDTSALLSRLVPGDVVFLDGSHRCFQNSDATVFFTEFIWQLPADTLIGIHDIFLPFDYPPSWIGRYYSEQYLLAAALLGLGERGVIRFPASYCDFTGLTLKFLAPLWETRLKGLQTHGGAFWLEIIQE